MRQAVSRTVDLDEIEEILGDEGNKKSLQIKICLLLEGDLKMPLGLYGLQLLILLQLGVETIGREMLNGEIFHGSSGSEFMLYLLAIIR